MTTPTPTEEAPATAYRALYPAAQSAERAVPTQREAILAGHAAEPLLNRMLRGIAALRATGRVTSGTPVLHPFDVKVKGDHATLHDCQDARKTGQADDKTAERLTHGVEKTHLIATLLRGPDGAWRVSALEQVDTPCVPAS